MAASSSSVNVNSTRGSRRLRSRCKCDDPVGRWTAWTPDNPGRRFIGCPNFRVNKSNSLFLYHKCIAFSTLFLMPLFAVGKRKRLQVLWLGRSTLARAFTVVQGPPTWTPRWWESIEPGSISRRCWARPFSGRDWGSSSWRQKKAKRWRSCRL